MKKLIIMVITCAVFSFGGESKKKYTVESDDLASLMFCIATLSDFAGKSNAGTCFIGVKACDPNRWDDELKDELCKNTSDICQEMEKIRKEMVDECTDLTNRIVSKLRRDGQLPSTGSPLRD